MANKAKAASSAAMIYWLIQQSQNYFVVASTTMPDLKVPEGEKRKKLLGQFPTAAEADTKGEELAAFYHGTFTG